MVLRIIDAYCARCSEPQAHEVSHVDPGSCVCQRCGSVQPLVKPLDNAVKA